MHAADDSPEGGYVLADQLRHDLKTPLTTIYGRAHLLARSIRRSHSLSDDERAKMLDAVATIETAVRGMVTLIDGIGPAPLDGRPGSTGKESGGHEDHA